MKLINSVNSLSSYLVVLILLLVSFFGVFSSSDGIIRTHGPTNYWAYAYITSLFLCSLVFIQKNSHIDKDQINYKVIISITFLISFLGLILGFVGTMDGTPGSLPDDKTYAAHYFFSSIIFNIVVGFKIKKLMGWFFFFNLMLNILFVLWIVFLIIF